MCTICLFYYRQHKHVCTNISLVDALSLLLVLDLELKSGTRYSISILQTGPGQGYNLIPKYNDGGDNIPMFMINTYIYLSLFNSIVNAHPTRNSGIMNATFGLGCIKTD